MAKKKTNKVPFSPSKSVEIKRIQNGYIVSTWGLKGQKEKYAKTQKEAKEIAGKMF
jgi:hypothetical protein